jgi:hypothetical protein
MVLENIMPQPISSDSTGVYPKTRATPVPTMAKIRELTRVTRVVLRSINTRSRGLSSRPMRNSRKMIPICAISSTSSGSDTRPMAEGPNSTPSRM